MNTRDQKSGPYSRWIVPALLLLIAAVAVALRLYRLDAVPPGLQHDEVFHGHDAMTVLLGYHPIYFPSNAGNEPLYIYLTAGTIALFGQNAWGIRLAAVICGLAAVGFTGLWIRRAYNTRTALIASALVAVTFWPLFMSRAGLRSAALPPLAAATAWLFWRAMQAAGSKTQDASRRSQVAGFVLAGAFLGVTLYTYPASRVLPIAYLLFALCLFTFHASRSTLYEFAAFFVTAGLVFLPLYLYLRQAPGADVRLQQLLEIGAVSALQKGNAGPLLANIRDTLGMFTFRGDPVWRYNIAGRPVFDPLVGTLFYVGLLVALWRIRQPRYLFALIWLPVGLLPVILSDSAPSFLRASASLPVTFLFPALGADWLIERFKWKRVLTAAIIGVVISSGALSVRDYFVTWPARPEVRAVYRSDLADVARWLDARPGDEPAVIASTNPHDVDPFLFDFELRQPRPIKWVDHAYGLIFPQGRALYISPAASPLAPELGDLLKGATVISQDSFVAYETDSPRIAPQVVLTAPVRFGDHLDLIGYQSPTSVKRGEWARVWTYWRVTDDTRGEQWPMAVFAHLLDAQGQFIAGRDLLAVPTAGWSTSNVWAQFQDVLVPPDTSPGAYSIEIGVYNRAAQSVQRWRLPDGSDRWLLPPIEIK
jgi:4-amino-4-deoxy-L-arabinose transferase-like glycosyltransferase